MNPVAMTGLSAAQARIAEIQARFAAPRFTLDAPASAGAAGVAAMAAGGATAPGAAAAGGAPGVAAAHGHDHAHAHHADAPRSAGEAHWAPHVQAAAARHGLDPRLLTALVRAESGFRPDAVSPAGAIGLGQLMPGTARALGVDPHDPMQNLDGAARYLKEQLDRFGRVDHALAAYNAGPGAVARAGGVPNYRETKAYVAKIMAELAGDHA